MSRFKITIQYDGTGFRGWQLQKSDRTVQGELESALKKMNKNELIRVHGAGRTDTGVHATGQVAHFDFSTEMDSCELKDALNGNTLRNDIIIIASGRMVFCWIAIIRGIRMNWIWICLQ